MQCQKFDYTLADTRCSIFADTTCSILFVDLYLNLLNCKTLFCNGCKEKVSRGYSEKKNTNLCRNLKKESPRNLTLQKACMEENKE